jgi:tRNA A-37 threonylcarbamoyl transferase component Bud32
VPRRAPERGRVCEQVARATRILHDAGGVHADLNLQNYLVRRRQGETEVLIIDCDKVVLRRVGDRDRRAAFDRLCRSIRRLDPESAVLTFECVQALRRIAEPGR